MTSNDPSTPEPAEGSGFSLRRAWLAAGLAGLVVFVTCGYFQNSRPGWNVNSQFALTLAIVERATLSIDAYHDRPGIETGDKAFFEGRYYSDKSPVTAFLGVPACWAYRQVVHGLGRPFRIEAARFWTTWLTIGLAAAVLATMLAWLLMRRGMSPEWAAAAAALWIGATPLLGYAILFFNYLPACAFGVGGWLLVDPLLRGEAVPERARARLFLGGVLLGLATWTLNTLGLMALGLTGALAWAAGRRGRALWPWAVGGILGGAGYVVYALVIFGHVTSPYAYEANEFFREQMARGFMGAGLPDLHVLYQVTLGGFIGLFRWFPATLIALGGVCWLAWRIPRERPLCAATLFVLGGLLAYNSAYFMWWGGWAYAARHLIPALPMLSLGLAAMMAGRHGGRRWIVAAVLVGGMLFNLTLVGRDPQLPPGVPQEVLMQMLQPGRWPGLLERYAALRPAYDANWGTALGLEGVASLAPLLLGWVAFGVGLVGLGHWTRRERAA